MMHYPFDLTFQLLSNLKQSYQSYKEAFNDALSIRLNIPILIQP